jgi:alkylhydroperoxidase family enzyme
MGEATGLLESLSSVPRSARWILPALSAAFCGPDVSTIDVRARALLLLRVASVDRAPYWRIQVELTAAELGITEDELILVGSDEWESTPSLTVRERAAILWGDRVARRLARRDKRAYETVRDVYSEEELVELTLVASLAAMASRITNALRVAPEGPVGMTPRAGDPGPDLRVWRDHMFDADLVKAWELL